MRFTPLAAALLGMPAIALANPEYSMDVNDLSVAITAGDTSIDVPNGAAGQLVDFTGTLRFFNDDDSQVVQSELDLDNTQMGLNGGSSQIFPGTGIVDSFELVVDLVNGTLQGGSLSVSDGTNSYMATVTDTQGIGVGVLFSAGNADAKLIGLTVMGMFGDTDLPLFGIPGLDVFEAANGMLVGTFDELNLESIQNAQYDVAFQEDIDIEVFIENPAIPLPTSAALAGMGLLAVGTRRRR